MNREELEAASGVTARNIRFLIAEGLLPPPVGAGRGASYTGEHLRALLTYAAAKERGVASLDVIRREIASGEEKIDIPVMSGVRMTVARETLETWSTEQLVHAVRTALEEFNNRKGERT